MARVALPHDAKAGPTKPEVRSVTLGKLDLGPSDHFVEIGSCTGAVTVEAARQAGRVTAIERKPERLETTEKNLAANDVEVAAEHSSASARNSRSFAQVELVEGEAPDGVPDDADALFIGGSRNFEAILDFAAETGVERIVMNVSRLEVAGDAVRAFRERDLFEEVVQVQVSTGYQLAGATSFDSNNPVYVVVGGTS